MAESVLSLPRAQCENAQGFPSQWCWSWREGSLMSNVFWDAEVMVEQFGFCNSLPLLLLEVAKSRWLSSSPEAAVGAVFELKRSCTQVLVGVAAQGLLLEVWHLFVFHQGYPVFWPVSNAYRYFCSSHGETCPNAWRGRSKSLCLSAKLLIAASLNLFPGNDPLLATSPDSS